MEGNDDEFSDLEDEYVDEDDPDTMDDPPTDSPAAASTRSSEEQQKWSTTTTKRLLIHPFTSTVGHTQDISSSPLEVFEQFFSPDLMERIVTESNVYAKAAMVNDKFDKWSKITVPELKAFLGFSVLMGINHLPSLNNYWSRDPRHWYHVERMGTIVSGRSDH